MRMQDAVGGKRPTNRRARETDVCLLKRRYECAIGLSSWHPNRITGIRRSVASFGQWEGMYSAAKSYLQSIKLTASDPFLPCINRGLR